MIRTFEPAARLTGLLAFIATAALPPRAAAAQATATPAVAPRPEAAAIRAIVDQRSLPLMRWPRLDDVADDLRSAYDATSWTPLWSRDGRPTPAALVVLEQFAAADARGLRVDDYDASALRLLTSQGALRTPEERAAFDVAISASTARFVRALRFGRVSASAAHAELRFAREQFDVGFTLRGLAGSTAPAAALDAFEPPYEHYRLLKKALAHYQTLARDTTIGGVSMTATLKPGGRDPAVPRLRRLLGAVGDTKSPLPDAAVAHDSTLYDEALVNAMRQFQSRQGFESDGVIGTATRARLARPFDTRIEQIALTLERWRWLPHVFTEPPVIVNVPAFRLHAFSSSSDREGDLLSMDVVVGEAFDHATPVFSDSLRFLVFSPYWEVPPSIARGEILPKARRDGGYLARGNYEIVDSRERVIAPTSSALSAVAAGRARFRQRPGPTNSLGRVKFIFPNAHNVYFHDTPAQAPFGRARRDASHGCIRLSQPARLAEFLLRTKSGWDSTRIAAAMSRTTPQQVDLVRPVPVHIVYATAVAREDGRVFFYEDIYGHDRTLARLLAGGYPYSNAR